MKDKELEEGILDRYRAALANELKGPDGEIISHPYFNPDELRTGTKAERLEYAKFYLRQVALFTGYAGLAEIAELLENKSRPADEPRKTKIQMRVAHYVYQKGLTVETAIGRTAKDFFTTHDAIEKVIPTNLRRSIKKLGKTD